MTNLTLTGWKRSVAAGVVETVPLQTFDSAFLLAEDFLSTQGGWNPDDPNDATGPGVPVSGVTLEQAIAQIFAEQQERIYQTDLELDITVRVILNQNLANGLSDDAVITNLTIDLEDTIEAQLDNTNLDLISISTINGAVTNGPTTSQERQTIQSDIGAGGKLINPKAIALVSARARFNLDSTYNVEYLYTEDDKDLAIVIAKYQSTQYVVIDSSANRYGIKLNPSSYKVTTGVVLSAQ